MSSLAFDKQGKPFTFDRRTKSLLVRHFRNPGARGTCCQVFDDDGQPLHIDPELDRPEFKKVTRHVPGLYRLDQCDVDGNELDAPAAYVSIDIARNAQGGGDGLAEPSPLVIIQQMAAEQADVMKTLAQEQARLMAATAEILRAPYRPAPIALPPPGADVRNADTDDGDRDDDGEHDDDELAPAPEHPMTAALRMIEPYLPQLGAVAYQKFMELFRELNGKKFDASPAPASAPMPAPTAATSASPPPPADEPVGVVAGTKPPRVASPSAAASPIVTATDTDTATDATGATAPIASAAPIAPSNDSAAHVAVTPATTVAPTASPTAPTMRMHTIAPSVPTLVSPPPVPASALPMPTPEQLVHLHAIRARLTDRERAIAERVIVRMDPALRAQYLAELSAMSVEKATSVIRDMVGEVTALPD